VQLINMKKFLLTYFYYGLLVVSTKALADTFYYAGDTTYTVPSGVLSLTISVGGWWCGAGGGVANLVRWWRRGYATVWYL